MTAGIAGRPAIDRRREGSGPVHRCRLVTSVGASLCEVTEHGWVLAGVYD